MTKIEWTEHTWNPIVGCSIVSPGCTNCYAMRMAARIEAADEAAYRKKVSAAVALATDQGHENRIRAEMNNARVPSHYAGTTQPSKAGPVWTGNVALAPERVLTEPLRRKKPTMYFVNSMGDLFHEDVADGWISMGADGGSRDTTRRRSSMRAARASGTWPSWRRHGLWG